MTARTGPPAKIPLSIVAGHLGADNTPILRALMEKIRDASFLSETLVINNESSSAPMAVTVAGVSEDVFADPATGCLCCTLSSAFPALLEKLLRARDNRRISPFVRVFVAIAENADPVPMIAGLLGHPYLSLRYRMSDVVTGVAGCPDRAMQDASLARRNQIAAASVLIMSPGTLAETATTQALNLARLEALNPAALRLNIGEALADPSRVFQGLPFDLGSKPEALRRSFYSSGIRPSS